MKSQAVNKKVVWRNYCKLMIVLVIFCTLISIYLYHSAVSLSKKQFCSINEQRVSLLKNNTEAIMTQIERLSAALCVDNETSFFFTSKEPERIIDNYYENIHIKLKSYCYGIDYIDSIILYSPNYARLFTDLGSRVIKDNIFDNIGSKWLKDYVKDIPRGSKNQWTFRKINDRYPYALTLVKTYNVHSTSAVIAISLNLEKLYNAIWTDLQNNETSTFVLNKDGKIVIQRTKNALLEERESILYLNNFCFAQEPLSELVVGQSEEGVYSQCYDENLGLYFAAFTKLDMYTAQIQREQRRIILLFASIILILGVLAMLYCRSSFRPLKSIMELLDNPDQWKESNQASDSEISEVTQQIIYHLDSNATLREELEKRLDMLQRTRVQALQSQINPHFLFNTLDLIGMMVEDDEIADDEVLLTINNLSDIIRYSLRGPEFVSITQELQYLKKYIQILKFRYMGRFDFVICSDPLLEKASIPRMILQPLVENAVFHGIAAKKADTQATLEVKCEKTTYSFSPASPVEPVCLITVADSGRGIDEDALNEIREQIKDIEIIDKHHIGLQNVTKRLYLLYPHKSRVEIESKLNVGTTVRLIFPYNESMGSE